MTAAYSVLDRTATAVTAGGYSGWSDTTSFDSWPGFLLMNALETSQMDWGDRKVRCSRSVVAVPNQSSNRVITDRSAPATG